MNDKYLDSLLSEYRSQLPTDFQKQKWKSAVRREIAFRKNTIQMSKERVWLSLIAASLVGFLIGALIYRTSENENMFQKFAQNSLEDATVEYVYTKSY